ncbi:MAG: hypothetical protein GY861_16850 [bacterium]|nr:hypothetical protein [bacterium]
MMIDYDTKIHLQLVEAEDSAGIPTGYLVYTLIRNKMRLTCPGTEGRPCYSNCLFFEIKKGIRPNTQIIRIKCRPSTITMVVEESDDTKET